MVSPPEDDMNFLSTNFIIQERQHAGSARDSHGPLSSIALPFHIQHIHIANTLSDLVQMSTLETIALPHLPQHHLCVGLFKNVKNAAFLRQQLLAGNADFEYAFLDASVVCRSFFSI